MPTVFTVDAHAGGEPCRVIVGGVHPLKGSDLGKQRSDFQSRFDWLRSGLMREPRGHANMFGCLLQPPVRKTSEYGLIFFDTEGYLDGCGHGTLCSVAVWRRLYGMVELPFTIDNPDGSMSHVLSIKGDQDASSVTIEMPPAHVLVDTVEIPGYKGVYATIAKCSNVFAIVSASDIGLGGLLKSSLALVQKKGREVMEALRPVVKQSELVTGLEIVFYEQKGSNPYLFATTVVFSGKQIDRSPCGTGSTALFATLMERGKIGLGEILKTMGPSRQQFTLNVAETGSTKDSARICLSGSSYVTGVHQWVFNDSDPLKLGFSLNEWIQ